MIGVSSSLLRLYGERKKLIAFRSKSEGLAFDIWYLTIILLLQVILCNRLFPFATTEIVIAWLIPYFIINPPGRCIVVGVLASIALETYYAVPVGFYGVTLWVIGTLIIWGRNHISWRNHLPWIVILALSSLWINLCEILLVATRSSWNLSSSLEQATTYGLRIIFVVAVGTFVVQKHLSSRLEDNELE